MSKRLHQRVAILIDTQNMYHSAKHIHAARLAFGKVAEALAHGRPIVRVIAYVAKSKTGEESAFFEALAEAGIELRIKDVQEFSSGEKKADWDVGMAVDAIKISEKVDVIVLMTGDGDFVPLVEYLKAHGTIVEVAAFGESTNAQLRAVCDSFYDISVDGREFLMTSRAARKSPSSRSSEAESEELVEFDMPHDAEAPETGAEDEGKGRKAGGSRRVRITY
jgi:uncharacterized LabA/DUF88 family protein